MNPLHLFPKTLGRIVAEPVVKFIEEIEGDVDALKAFFEAQEQAKEKAEQAKKNYDNFEENSKQPFAPNFFCPEYQEPEPERRSSSEESARSPSPDPDSKPTYLIPELDIKRGFGLAEHPSFQSLPSSRLNPPLQTGVQELIKKFDYREPSKKSASGIDVIAKSLIENTKKLRARISEDSRREQEIEEGVIKEDPKLPPENFEMKEILPAELGFNNAPLNQNHVQSNGNQGVGEKFGKESNTQDSEKTYQSNQVSPKKNVNNERVTAELGFEGEHFSNQSYVQSEGGLQNRSRKESEEKKTSNCLEKFSCVRLENLNKNCSIS